MSTAPERAPGGGSPASPPRANGGRRRAVLSTLAGIFLVAGLAVAVYWLLIGQYRETTDDAYVQGNVVQVTSQVAGTVVSIGADNTDLVEQGQVLVRLDDADARVQLQAAEANLAEAVRAVRGLYASDSQTQALVTQRAADVDRARHDATAADAEARKAADEYRRREQLFRDKYISAEALQTARTSLQATLAQRDSARSRVADAQAALVQAREQQVGSAGLIDNTSIETHPRVAAAESKVREAYLAFARTSIVAPVRGYVAKRSVQLGQRIAPGDPLMAIIALDDVWVDANFKESQLENVRIGQPVKLTADLYGSDVKYAGRIAGLGAGTGSVFSLLPAQNATGNWIKIVQRVPVRIALEPKDLAAHPLRIGLSMEVSVDVSDTRGKTLADAPRSEPLAQTRVFDVLADAADAEVARVIRANSGRAATPAKAH
jgi:membrane fusion protein, multidrug efflux system